MNRDHRTAVALETLRSCIAGARELEGGYALLFTGHSRPVLALTEILGLEELACPSIKIRMDEGSRLGDATWVHFTGGECIKEFVRKELVRDQGDARARR